MRSMLVIAIVVAGLGVALGAFGAHGLKRRVPEEAVKIYHTGVQYQLTHALAMILVASLVPRWISETSGMWVDLLFLLGVILFSGSLYALTLGWLKGRWGLITPVGGLFFLAGWTLLAVRAL
ncbi:MAG: DUF423 domain-containing protein [Firmicutes bacterium]|nr:DUF423 domain-containing protein [Bacillota bacterium]